MDGFPGRSGAPGEQGLPGIIPPELVRQAEQGCRQCPPGPQGLPGFAGAPGDIGREVRLTVLRPAKCTESF